MVLKLNTPFIKLCQALKAVHFVDSGAEAKDVITEGFVKVNNETELRRGRKLYPGDQVSFQNKTIEIQ